MSGAFLQSELGAALTAAPVMAILRGLGREHTVRIAHLLWEAGVRCVEVPLQSTEDEAALIALRLQAAPDGAITGAGTILSVPQVERAVELGAQFIVSPGFALDVVTRCRELGIAPLPGVGTASDVQAASVAGLEWVKGFPAAALGRSWFAALHAPFPTMQFVATGGIDAVGAGMWLETPGIGAVSLGSALADPGFDLGRVAELIRSVRAQSQ